MYGRQGKDLAGNSVLYSMEEFSFIAFHLENILGGLLGVYIWALVAIIVPAIKEFMQKLCNTGALIALVKETTSIG